MHSQGIWQLCALGRGGKSIICPYHPPQPAKRWLPEPLRMEVGVVVIFSASDPDEGVRNTVFVGLSRRVVNLRWRYGYQQMSSMKPSLSCHCNKQLCDWLSRMRSFCVCSSDKYVNECVRRRQKTNFGTEWLISLDNLDDMNVQDTKRVRITNKTVLTLGLEKMKIGHWAISWSLPFPFNKTVRCQWK